MQARTTSPQAGNLATWLVAVLGVGLLVILLLSFILEGRSGASTQVAGVTTSSRIAYFEFGREADTLWLANPNDPSDRKRLFAVTHAPEFGVVPSVAPDGRSFAYTALPPDTRAPSHHSPAGLWVAAVSEKAAPKLIAPDVDLLVRPVWSADSRSLVYRRSTATGYVLAILPVAGGEERVIASSDTSALFPVGFAQDGDRVYYVAIDEAAGSRLFEVELASGVSRFVTALSLGLTRDWSISPDGSKVAYLEIGIGPDEVSSRALVFDSVSGETEAVTERTTSAFSPVWSADDSLLVGTLDQSTGRAGLLHVDTVSRTLLDGPARGFEVPLSVAPSSTGFVVRAFENPYSYSPGRSSLAFVDADGERQTIATGEVTFVGWTNP